MMRCNIPKAWIEDIVIKIKSKITQKANSSHKIKARKTNSLLKSTRIEKKDF